MSILGLTLDYGPFGFLDKFDPAWTPNLSDPTSRYSYQAQPEVVAWNVVKLGEALNPLLDLEGGSLMTIHEGVERYFDAFETTYHTLMAKELIGKKDAADILNPLLKLLETCHVDYHLFFRFLGEVSDALLNNPGEINSHHPAATLLLGRTAMGPDSLSYAQDALTLASAQDGWLTWLKNYRARLSYGANQTLPSELMRKSNPRFVLRNWIAQDVISALQKKPSDLAPLKEVFDLLVTYPFSEDAEIDWKSSPPSFPAASFPIRFQSPSPIGWHKVQLQFLTESTNQHRI
ncbi:hypothetical protein L0F63_005702, partial [Massospora cicadina]